MTKRDTKTKTTQSSDPKRSKGRLQNKPTATNVKEYMNLKKPFTHLGLTVNPLNIAKVPQILLNLGKFEQAQGRMKQSEYQALLRQVHQVDNSVSAFEADSRIQGLKCNVRKERIYGSYDPMGLQNDANQIQLMVQTFLVPQQMQLQQETNIDYNFNINDRLDQPSQRAPNKIVPSAPLTYAMDSDDERMEKFGGYNRYQIISQQDLNSYFQDLNSQTSFAPKTDALQKDIQNEKEKDQIEEKFEKDNAKTNREQQYIEGLNLGQEPVNPHYSKRSIAQINDFCYKVVDQGLSVYPKKQSMADEEQINQPKKQKKYISNREQKSTLKAQSKLKNNTKRKSHKK